MENASLTTNETLAFQRRAWEERPLLRDLYRSWFRRLERELAPVEGPTIELGCGIGTLKEALPQITATDVVPTPWADEIVDAEEMPWDDASVANLVMVDVLHHIPNPDRFLADAARVLRPGGRLVALEPYCSPFAMLVWKAFHHEPVDTRVDPFDPQAKSSDDPFDSNTALPTLLFWRHLDELRRRRPELEVVRRQRFACFVYPLSGGFSGPRLCPPAVGRLLMRVDDRLGPLARALALRCLVTVEKRDR